MKKFPLCLLLLILGAFAAHGADSPDIFQELNQPSVRDHWQKGDRIAAAVAQLTGEAMCPFLGLGAHGAYVYYKTAAPEREKLAWHYQPWCWGIMLALAGLVFLNATGGEALTPMLKKPIEALNEILAVGGATVTLPLAAGIFAGNVGEASWLTSVSIFPTAMAGESGALATANWGLLWLAGLVTAGVVWICWHLVDVMIIISPFPFVDALLRGGRATLMLGLAALTALSPFLGLCVSLLIIAICALLCGWCGRFVLYAWTRFYDLFFGRVALPIRAFSARGLKGCATRTRGTLSARDGELVFRYRRWFIAPRETVLPFDGYLRDGQVVKTVGERTVPLLTLLPSATAQADDVARMLHLTGAGRDDNAKTVLVTRVVP
ncbi:hypothetical protein FACS1894107_06620 [Planctomycetales bacterium]|nr:hypothetical protein FACS1894107_06620 [Planctomycetales bacterium]